MDIPTIFKMIFMGLATIGLSVASVGMLLIMVMYCKTKDEENKEDK